MDIVPPEVLELVPADQLRDMVPDEAALQLDGYLRRLGRQEARCRRVLGRLARPFVRRKDYHALGFARLGDYTRERLGLSAREVQSVVHVVDALEKLPATVAAFERGEISWSQARLLVGAVNADTEEHWLAVARRSTVRVLEAELKAAREQEGATGAPSERESQQGPPSEDEEAIDGEPRVVFRLNCPSPVVALWREVVDLARRMAGEELPVWQAAEAIAAEGLSAQGPVDDDGPPKGKPAWRVPCESSGKRPDTHETTADFPGLDWAAVAEAIPGEVERLADNPSDLDAFALDQRMRAAIRALQRVDWQTGRLLRFVLDTRLHWMMGFASASRYVRERLGISPRKARALVALERKTWYAPGLGEAYRSGDISWLRALTILPVVDETEVAGWLARARTVTVRRLVDEVEWAMAVREAKGTPWRAVAPPPNGARLEWPTRQMRAPTRVSHVDAEVTFPAPASVAGLLWTAIRAFGGPGQLPWVGMEELLLHVRAEWERQPRHRDPVFAREGWRCAVPVCTGRRNLQDHHLVFRSHGGQNNRDNRLALCAWHHLRAIHSGTVRAEGQAPDGILWQIGTSANHPPLILLRGASYVTAPAEPL